MTELYHVCRKSEKTDISVNWVYIVRRASPKQEVLECKLIEYILSE